MATEKVISIRNLPTRPPTLLTFVVWLLSERPGISLYLVGAIWTVLALFWLCFFIQFFREEQVDLFKQDRD